MKRVVRRFELASVHGGYEDQGLSESLGGSEFSADVAYEEPTDGDGGPSEWKESIGDDALGASAAASFTSGDEGVNAKMQADAHGSWGAHRGGAGLGAGAELDYENGGFNARVNLDVNASYQGGGRDWNPTVGIGGGAGYRSTDETWGVHGSLDVHGSAGSYDVAVKGQGSFDTTANGFKADVGLNVKPIGEIGVGGEWSSSDSGWSAELNGRLHTAIANVDASGGVAHRGDEWTANLKADIPLGGASINGTYTQGERPTINLGAEAHTPLGSGGVSIDFTDGNGSAFAATAGASLETKLGGAAIQGTYESGEKGDWGVNLSANVHTPVGSGHAEGGLFNIDGRQSAMGTFGLETPLGSAVGDARYTYRDSALDVNGGVNVTTPLGGVDARAGLGVGADGQYGANANFRVTTPYGDGALGGAYASRPNGAYDYRGTLQIGSFNALAEHSSNVVGSEEGDYLRNRASLNFGGYNLYDMDTFTPRQR